MNNRILQIKKKVDTLLKIMNKGVYPTASLIEIETFENRHKVQLPEEYRTFLLEVYNGGPGPEYGLVSLNESSMPSDGLPEVESTVTWNDGQESVSVSTPSREKIERTPNIQLEFPFDKAWRPVDDQGNELDMPIQPNQHPYDGCLYLAEIGCGYFYMLVVSGPERGKVWVDYTAGDGSISPLDKSFLDWYEEWLDDSLIGWARWYASEILFEKKKLDPEILRPWLPEFVNKWKIDDTKHLINCLEISLALKDLEQARILLSHVDDENDVTLAYQLQHIHEILELNAFKVAKSKSHKGKLELTQHPLFTVRRALATNANCPEEVQLILARDSHREVYILLAQQEYITTAVIEELLNRKDIPNSDQLILKELCLSNMQIAPEIINETLQAFLSCNLDDPATSILRAGALNGNTSAALLQKLAQHPAPWVRQGVAFNPACSTSLQELLAKDKDAVVRSALAWATKTPSILNHLAQDSNSSVRKKVANNPFTPMDTLLELAAEGDMDIQDRLRLNPSRTDMLSTLFSLHPTGDGKVERRKIHEIPEWGDVPLNCLSFTVLNHTDNTGRKNYGHPAYPVYRLNDAFESDDNMATYSMTSHPWLEIEQLERLAEDSYSYTRSKVASHPNVTEELLVKLSDDRVAMVRGSVASNPKTPTEIINRLAEDAESDTRSGAARNPNLSLTLVAQLAEDTDVWTRRNLLFNPIVSDELLKEFAKDEDPQVRKWVPVHPNVSLATVELLKEDKDKEVKRSVKWYYLYQKLKDNHEEL